MADTMMNDQLKKELETIKKTMVSQLELNLETNPSFVIPRKENTGIKLSMAQELLDKGLSEEAVQRILHLEKTDMKSVFILSNSKEG